MYPAKTFDWSRVAKGLIAVIKDAVGLPCVYESNKQNNPDMPLVTFAFLNDHTSVSRTTTKNSEGFVTTVTLKAQAQDAGDALAISDDLRTLLQGDKCRDQLKTYGIVLAPNPVQDNHIDDSNSIPFMNHAVAGFDLIIQLTRHYREDIPTIKKVEQGKDDLDG